MISSLVSFIVFFLSLLFIYFFLPFPSLDSNYVLEKEWLLFLTSHQLSRLFKKQTQTQYCTQQQPDSPQGNVLAAEVAI